MKSSKMKMTVDSHTHPYQVRRCYEEMELYAETALAKGLTGIAFTEHAPMSFPLDSHFLTEAELERYMVDGLRCQKAYKGKLDITLGVEADYFPANMDYLAKLIDRYQIPYVSASIHFHLDFWQQTIGDADPRKRTQLALKATLEAVQSGLYQTLNHLDFFRLRQASYEPELFEDNYREIFEAMVAHDVALEWNANGLHRDFMSPMPCAQVWRWSLDYPLRRTFGSDAHHAGNIAFQIDGYGILPPSQQPKN